MGVGADEDIPHFSPDVALAGGTEGGEVGGVEGGGGGGGRGGGEKLGERHGWYRKKNLVVVVVEVVEVVMGGVAAG